jgi:hypothetical protein
MSAYGVIYVTIVFTQDILAIHIACAVVIAIKSLRQIILENVLDVKLM